MNQILGAIKEMRHVAKTVTKTVSGLSGLDNYLSILEGVSGIYDKIPFGKFFQKRNN